MWSLFQQTKQLTAGVRERYSRLCDDACRRAALQRQVLLHQVWRSAA
jgi:hypothetical protein